MKRVKFRDIVSDQKGFLRGPFGGHLKKEILQIKLIMCAERYD